MINKDSTLGTIVVAAVVCFVCSLGVVAAATALKDQQLFNAKVDMQRNLLKVVKLADGSTSPDDINKTFAAKLEPIVVELKTGKTVSAATAGIDPATYDQYREAKDNGLPLGDGEKTAGFSAVPKYAVVYKVQADGDTGVRYIIPINGAGLWGEMRGFLALESDRNTVVGINFYQQKETPGLGARVASDDGWLAKWPQLKAYNAKGEAKLGVNQGPDVKPHLVEGLTGATLTSRGVDNLVKFWLGPNGFGPYLKSNN